MMRVRTILPTLLAFACAFAGALFGGELDDRVKAIGRAKSAQERYDIVKELREKGDEARDALRAGLKDENDSVRAESIRLLAALKNEADLDDLLKIAANIDEKHEVRIAAVYSLQHYTKNADKVRSHLLSRYKSADVEQAERVALLEG
ncbi:MAG: HEAT repeat domain-containing protein, partial [Planctomycetes bacterium]|nr:HEAT repeat domain-containing protein [Planctomycetota bacterium]